ncbi:MAG: tRNA 2-selenouridine(34) synthase MnmH [Gammaproteobacteria bacterium]|nr:tRNA 2-selenouridine(34) synthase MnmH [Gammaproteobacteria bacterium]
MSSNLQHTILQAPDEARSLYRSLFLDKIPLLDVRAPIEFIKGAFPLASNLPLLDDDERRRVGTAYKLTGQQAAIDLGHRLVCGEIKEQRVEAWKQWRQAHPQGWLYCFRGGLRSQIAQQWLSDAGVQIPRVPGGYKALRQFLTETIEEVSETRHFVVVAGPTGSGKTALLRSLTASADLEGLAGHRGSAFGSQLGGQPEQINFENALAIRFLQLSALGAGVWYLEDESKAIGSLSVPHRLYEAMRRSPLALIRAPLETRTNTILNDYICENLLEFQQADPALGFTRFSQYLLGSLARIQRRLGGDRYQEIAGDMQEALRIQTDSGDTDAHAVWIVKLLQHYYDPMYAYQLSKRQVSVSFEGSGEEFLSWAQVPATA